MANAASSGLNICIFGSHDVGKSALAVRLLTNRFISSYIQNSPTLTCTGSLQLPSPTPPPQRTTTQSGTQTSSCTSNNLLHLTVRDVNASDGNVDKILSDHLSWGQCHIVVCTRNDRSSLDYAQHILGRHLDNDSRGGRGTPIILVANKSDVSEDVKAVPLEECHELALMSNCLFFEVSVMESPVGPRLVLMALLGELLKESSKGQVPTMAVDKKQFLMTTRRLWLKVLGALCKNLCSLQLPQTA